MSADKEYFRAADIAQLTGMSPRTVRRWIAAKILPSTKLGGARLVARADLHALLSPFPTQFSDCADYSEEDDGDSRK
jgi:excisionase family DNA binding protein